MHNPQLGSVDIPWGNLKVSFDSNIWYEIFFRLFLFWNTFVCLLSIDEGEFSGIISERDYVKKIALLGKVSKDTLIKDIYIHSRNVTTASVEDSIEGSMNTMMTKGFRHLPIMDGEKLVGMVSIKDLIKEVVADREKTIRDLSEIALGEGSTNF